MIFKVFYYLRIWKIILHLNYEQETYCLSIPPYMCFKSDVMLEIYFFKALFMNLNLLNLLNS